MRSRSARNRGVVVAACLGLGLALAGSARAAGDAPAGTAGGARLVVEDDGGFDQTVVRAMHALTLAALSDRGVPVARGARAGEAGGARLFVLRIGGQLEHKVPLSLEEVDPLDQRPLFAASLVATGLDEADRVIPRLVEAVLTRRPADEAVRFDTVTVAEGETPPKRGGEGRWLLGLSGATVGFSLGWMHETRSWRVGPMLEVYPEAAPGGDRDRYGESGRAFMGVNGVWLPRDGAFSPYLGGGLGIVGRYTADTETDEVGAKLEAGVEWLRLNRVRLMVGADLTLSPSRSWGAFHMRMGF